MAKAKAKAKPQSEVVKVEMSDLLLEVVDKCAERFNRSREEFILLACQHYIGQIDAEEYERLYRDGCIIEPNEQEWAEGAAKIAAQVWE